MQRTKTRCIAPGAAMSEELRLLESKVRLLATRISVMQEGLDSLTLRMSNLERAHERLAKYVGGPPAAIEAAADEVKAPLGWETTRTDESD